MNNSLTAVGTREFLHISEVISKMVPPLPANYLELCTDTMDMNQCITSGSLELSMAS